MTIEDIVKIKKAIDSPQCKIVSFDIFDTLVVRPLWYPHDLFVYLGVELNKSRLYFNQPRVFAFLRRLAERKARRQTGLQDITITEIYRVLARWLRIPKDKEQIIIDLEIKMEEEICESRNIGKHLYDFAVSKNKSVICVTDMYLPMQAIRGILKKCGFCFTDRSVYISGELGISKHNGDLYKHVLSAEGGIAPENVVHIGDNYFADVVKAKENGIKPFHLKSNKDLYKDRYGKLPKLMSLMRRTALARDVIKRFDFGND